MEENKTSEIFNKEVLTIKDIMILYCLTYSGGAKFMRELKNKQDRLHMKGRIHKLDYFAIINQTEEKKVA